MSNFLKSLKVKGIEIDPAGATSAQVLSYNGTKFVPVTNSATAGLKYLGTNTYTTTTTITPSTVSPNAKLALVTVISGGGGSGGCGATGSTQVAISQSGANGAGVQAVLYNNTYSTTNCFDFSQVWEVIVGAGGSAGASGVNGGGNGQDSYLRYPVGSKNFDWYIWTGGGGAGNGCAATTPPLYQFNSPYLASTASVYGVSATATPLLVKYTVNTEGWTQNASYATSTTFSSMAGNIPILSRFNSDYITSGGTALIPNYTRIFTTANSNHVGSATGYGCGGVSRVRLGTNAATAGIGGGTGVVYISWFG